MLRHMVSNHKAEREENDSFDDTIDSGDDHDHNASDDEGSETSEQNPDDTSEHDGDSDVEEEGGEEEEEEEEEEDADIYNIWAYLKKCANIDPHLMKKFDDAKERLADDELSEKEVEAQAFRVVKPEMLKHIYDHYTNYLKMWHFAAEDKYHRQVSGL